MTSHQHLIQRLRAGIARWEEAAREHRQWGELDAEADCLRNIGYLRRILERAEAKS